MGKKAREKVGKPVKGLLLESHDDDKVDKVEINTRNRRNSTCCQLTILGGGGIWKWIEGKKQKGIKDDYQLSGYNS